VNFVAIPPARTTGSVATVLLAACALIGLAVFVWLTPKVNPRASVDVRYSRADIEQRATEFLQGMGLPVNGLDQGGWIAMDGTTQRFLSRRVGMEEANRILRSDSLSAHYWNIFWYNRNASKTQTKESFTVWMSLGGEVLGFSRDIKDSVTLPSLDTQAARELARRFLQSRGIDLDGYAERTANDLKQANRIDHHFVLARGDSLSENTVWIHVLGNQIGGFRRNFAPLGEFAREITEGATTATLVGTGSFSIVFLLVFFIIILFLKKYHEGEVGTRTGVLAFIGIFVVSALGVLNTYHSLGAFAQIGDLNYANVTLVIGVMYIFIIEVFLGAMVFAGWSVGESSARSVWPDKLAAADSALFRQFTTVDLGRSVLRGFGFGMVMLGVLSVCCWLILLSGKGLFLLTINGVGDAIVPGLQPILTAFSTAVFGEVIFRLFFISYLKEKTRKVWPGVLVSTILWTAAGYAMWDHPFGFLSIDGSIVFLFLLGLVMSFLFLRYDLVTSIVSLFVIVAFPLAVPLFVSSSAVMVAGRYEFLAAILLPVAVAVYGFFRGGRFEFSLETMPAHIKRISERERMAKELEIARNVQMRLLPKANPIMEGFDIAGVCLPALEVGGDYYDFVNLGGRKLGIAIGDVSGKGVPAAIYMTLTKGILQSHAEENVSPRSVLTKVNTLMYRSIERNSFVSMFYAVLDKDRATITFSRAGQCPIILTERRGEQGKFLSPKGMALGLEHGPVFDAVLEEQTLPLRSGEVLVFYTDGFTEAMNAGQDEFGEERLEAAVSRHRDKSSSAIIEAVCEEVKTFAGDALQHDDMTMIVLKVL
jgi:sigma-B regulation protein RsbU (phosphoserine phosphatase)